MRTRYVNLLLGLGPVVPGLVIGWLIPIGHGSAVLIGGALGIAAGYLLVYGRPGKKMQFWLASSNQSKEQHLGGQISQRVIETNTLSAREAHIEDMQRLDQIIRE